MLLRRRGSVDWSEREGRRYLCGDYLSYRGLGALERRPAFGADSRVCCLLYVYVCSEIYGQVGLDLQ